MNKCLARKQTKHDFISLHVYRKEADFEEKTDKIWCLGYWRLIRMFYIRVNFSKHFLIKLRKFCEAQTKPSTLFVCMHIAHCLLYLLLSLKTLIKQDEVFYAPMVRHSLIAPYILSKFSLERWGLTLIHFVLNGQTYIVTIWAPVRAKNCFHLYFM